MIVEIWQDDMSLVPIPLPEDEEGHLQYGREMADLKGTKILKKVIHGRDWDDCTRQFLEYEDSLRPEFEEFKDE